MKKTDFSLSNDLPDVYQARPEDIVTLDKVQELSMSEMKQRKDELRAKRDYVLMQLDGKKLEMAVKTMDALDAALDQLTDPDKLKHLNAAERKFLSESMKNLTTTYQTLSRMDTIDGSGTPKRLSLRVDFGGTSVQTIIENNS